VVVRVVFLEDHQILLEPMEALEAEVLIILLEVKETFL
jgi:hypothetical protein